MNRQGSVVYIPRMEEIRPGVLCDFRRGFQIMEDFTFAIVTDPNGSEFIVEVVWEWNDDKWNPVGSIVTKENDLRKHADRIRTYLAGD